jgi:hypothetical protein
LCQHLYQSSVTDIIEKLNTTYIEEFELISFLWGFVVSMHFEVMHNHYMATEETALFLEPIRGNSCA